MRVADLYNVHFIGIGGIGMSALARYFNHLAVNVSGYDRSASDLTKKLVEEGISIWFDERPKRIDGLLDLVVYTPAIPSDHAELLKAKEEGIPILKRAEVLGLISRDFETLAVAGTHGKTTTSCMLDHLLWQSQLKPTAFLGGITTSLQSNFRIGEGKYMVTEADEFDRSFLHLEIKSLILTSLDADHLEVYGDREEMVATYQQLLLGLKEGSQVFLESDVFKELETFTAQLDKKGIKVWSYGQSEQADFKIESIALVEGQTICQWTEKATEIKHSFASPMPGEHNVHNALGAISLAMNLGVKAEIASKALEGFKGIHRRFERKFNEQDLIIIDDYAHHPTEIRAAIKAARLEFGNRRIIGIFQAHLYTRTRDFMSEFECAFEGLDELWTCEIYPAREAPIEGVTGEVLIENVDHDNKHYSKKSDLARSISLDNGPVILVMGAGNINSIIPEIIERFEQEK